jgi:hypothetical protein
MPPRNWEKVRAEQRQRARGVERLSGTGYTLELVARASMGAASAERFIQEAQRWEPMEQVAERNTALEERRMANKGSGEPLRSILDACED